MVTVIRYHLQQHRLLRGTVLARDTVYGLFTAIFLLLIVYVYEESAKHTNRSPELVHMEDELRRYIIHNIESQIASGEPPPPLQPLFSDLDRDPTSALSEETAKKLEGRTDLRRQYVAYVRRLGDRIGRLEHVNLAREY